MTSSSENTPVPSSLTWLGRVVADRYEIRRQVAKGAMGRVFLATQHPLGREVAVKVLETHEALDDSGEYEQRFLKEASTLARLSHPNTVRVYDYGSFEGRLYLVMEFVDGRTLRAILREEGRLAPERALRIGRQIAGSLAEAHDLGVVHRDLKPGNVLITERTGRGETVKVVDFGLVKELAMDEELTGVGLLLGTPRFMAPEQITGGDVDGRTDLYSLGVILYQLLTGRPPFTDTPTAALLRAQLSDPPPSFAEAAPDLDLPQAVEWTVRCCLAKKPGDRFVDAWQLIEALDASLVTLRDPAWRDATLHLDQGHVVAPFTVDDASGSSESRSRAAVVLPARRARAWLPILALVLLIATLVTIAGGVGAAIIGLGLLPAEEGGAGSGEDAGETQVLKTDAAPVDEVSGAPAIGDDPEPAVDSDATGEPIDAVDAGGSEEPAPVRQPVRQPVRTASPPVEASERADPIPRNGSGDPDSDTAPAPPEPDLGIRGNDLKNPFERG